jgi:hypothetical protein
MHNALQSLLFKSLGLRSINPAKLANKNRFLTSETLEARLLPDNAL